ncbi:hypothetical protein OSTOST_07500 [Ostertagia ostertagi]
MKKDPGVQKTQHGDRAPAAADEAVKSTMPDEEQQKNLQQQQHSVNSQVHTKCATASRKDQ